MYNLTNLTNANTPVDIIIFANENVKGSLFGGFIIALWFVFFIIMKKYSFERAFLTSSFLCFLISIFFVNATLINFYFIIVFATMTLFGGLWMYLSPEY